VDYKTGLNTVKWGRIYHGLALQLAAYLLAVRQDAAELASLLKLAAEPQAAGAFYQRILVPPEPGEPSVPGEPVDPLAALEPYRRCGLFNSEVATMLDVTVRPQSKSMFVHVSRNKDGALSSRSGDALAAEEFDGLLDWATRWMKQLGESMLRGDVAVRPYRLSNDSPCSFCDFRAVCRLDFDYNRPRYLPRADRKRLMSALGGPLPV